MSKTDLELMAHLMRRAGFGASREELDSLVLKGYENVVEELLSSQKANRMPDEIARRYHPELSSMMYIVGTGQEWLYRLATTESPLEEKISLFWHGIFATGYPKITNGKVLSDQIRMFRRYGLESFQQLLLELAKDPAMIIWLDNQDNHKEAVNENFGRELLELFSMGVGNYTEEDVKECARAFTGWTIGNTEYMALRGVRDSIWPYGRISWHFEYKPEDHDDGEKVFLGHKGKFNGDDIIDIICKQDATAKFVARHLYHFFVADEPPVPSWPYTPPRDPDAINQLSKVYFDSNYNIKAMLRSLFNSDYFKSESIRYEKVKSPAELVAGVLRLTGELQNPGHVSYERSQQMVYMGQYLNNPSSVEGWHEGLEWIDTGTLVERTNFVAQQLGDLNNKWGKTLVTKLSTYSDDPVSPEDLIDICLDEIGAVSVSDETRETLIDYASQNGRVSFKNGLGKESFSNLSNILQLIATTYEYQRS